jgi:hypothetical protein
MMLDSSDDISNRRLRVNVPCYIHIEGVDWFKTPMYRFFKGPKPTFLGSILFKRQMQMMKESRTAVPKVNLTQTIDYNPLNNNNGQYCSGYCQHCHRHVNFSIDATSSQNDRIIDQSTIDNIVRECEKHDTSPLLGQDSAYVTCAIKPHFGFEITDEEVTVTFKTYDSINTTKVSLDDFISWCMVPDDSNVSRQLDDLMEIYFAKSIIIASPSVTHAGTKSDNKILSDTATTTGIKKNRAEMVMMEPQLVMAVMGDGVESI